MKLAALILLVLPALNCFAKEYVSLFDRSSLLQPRHIQAIMEAVKHQGQPFAANPEVRVLTFSLDPKTLPALALRETPGPTTQVTLTVKPNLTAPPPLDLPIYGPEKPKSQFHGLTVILEQGKNLERPWDSGKALRLSANIRPGYRPIAPARRAPVRIQDAWITRVTPNPTVKETLPRINDLRLILRPIVQEAFLAIHRALARAR